MSLKALIWVFCVALISLSLAIFSLSKQPKFAEIKNGEVVFPELIKQIDNIQKIYFETHDRKMTMLQRANKWIMVESDGYEMESNQIRSAILGFASLRYVDPKTKKKENYFKLDLRDPSEKESRGRAVKIFDSKGTKLVDVVLGRSRYNMPGTTKGGIYFRQFSSGQTWLGVGDLEMSRLPEDWLKTKIINVPLSEIDTVRSRHGDGETILVERDTSNSDFILRGIPPNKQLKYDSDPKNMAGVLQNLELEDVRKVGAIDFGAKSTTEIEFITKNGLAITLNLVKIIKNKEEDEEYWVTVTANTQVQKIQGKVDQINSLTSPWVYKIPSYKATRLDKRLTDFLEAKKPKS